MEKQTVVLGDGTDADVVAFAEDPLEAAVQVFHVRGGRVRGQRGWVVEKTEDLTTGDLVHHFCTQVYGGEHGEADVPRELLVPELPADAEALADWLSEHRGSRVTLRVPQRGDKKALLETVARNAGQALAQHKLRRAGDLTSRSKALEEIAEALGLDTAPLRIECFDVSQIQGTDVVASMVVFEDGLPRKSEYRRFAVARRAPTTSRPSPRCCAGGSPATWLQRDADALEPADQPAIDPDDRPAAQVRVPAAAGRGRRRRSRRSTRRPRCSPSWASPTSRCAGWPSGWRRCGCPATTFPVILPRTSEGLYLLQRVRDEAHRFAITYHRQRRSKRMTASTLDGVPGPGRGAAQGAAAALRLAQAAGRGERRGDRRGAGHRPAHGRGDPGRPRRRAVAGRAAGRAGEPPAESG